MFILIELNINARFVRLGMRNKVQCFTSESAMLTDSRQMLLVTGELLAAGQLVSDMRVSSARGHMKHGTGWPDWVTLAQTITACHKQLD